MPALVTSWIGRRAGRIASALLACGLMGVVLAAPPVDAAEPAKAKPNIVVVLVDDIGYSDLGCYGGEIATPNLDKLAGGGLRFTQFYNTGRCCPTRASLLTGLYPHQAGIGHMMEDNGYDGYRGDLNTSCRTLAEVLGPAGYRCYAVGKWHVTRFAGPEASRHNWPRARGFDRYYGIITGAGNFYDPPTLTRDDTPVTIHTDPEYPAKDYYFTDALTDNACRYIAEHDRDHADRPFLVYLAYTAAHWPMHAPEADVAAYRGKYGDGYDAYRQARYARMKELGVIPAGCELSPTVGDWDAVEHKAWEARCMEVYAAMIGRMDAGIGKVVRTLEESGELDNTLILFMQDNGGCQEEVGRRPPAKPLKAMPPFPKDRVMVPPVPNRTRDGRPMRTGPDAMPGPEDTYIAYGLKWANVSNTPFRFYKHYVHEGGIATPLIMHWPAAMTASPGGLVATPSHLIDVMATCVDAAGAEYPTEVDGRSITPLEGVPLTPALAGEPIARETPLFWEHEGNRAVRDGKWKLVAVEDGPWELYDMEADRSELHDLAKAQPDRAAAMAKAWDGYAERANVLPLGGWKKANPEGRLPEPKANRPTATKS